MTDRLLRLRDVQAKTSLGKTTIYVRMKSGEFPPCVTIGSARAWRESDIDRWISSLPTTPQPPAATPLPSRPAEGGAL